MGSFYTNVTLKTGDAPRVRHLLTGRRKPAYLSRVDHDALVVFDADSESQDPDVLRDLAAKLTGALDCAALAVLNHDDSDLFYLLFRGGALIDEYESAPEYFGEARRGDHGADVSLLATTFGATDRAQELSQILGAGPAGEGEFVFETERHARLVDALGLPRCAIATGYTYLEAGEYPEGYHAGDFERIA